MSLYTVILISNEKVNSLSEPEVLVAGGGREGDGGPDATNHNVVRLQVELLLVAAIFGTMTI